MIRIGGIVVEDSERKECEVWTRVMGYYRPVECHNIGKRQEHRDRCFFRIPKEVTPIPTDALQ